MDILKELKKNGLLLKKILKKNQTIEICKVAIKQNPLALQFASGKCLDTKLCLGAIKKDVSAFPYVPKKFITKEMCEIAVKTDPQLLSIVPESFRTSEICIMAVKKDVNTLSYVSEEKRYKLFDGKTELALIEKVVAHTLDWLKYMPNRPDVRALCIKYMEENFSAAQYMPEQIKISNDILDYQKQKGKLVFLLKYYDPTEKLFMVKTKVIYNLHSSIWNEDKMQEESYFIIIKFENFNKFYDFLSGNLLDAELRSYDFKGIDLRKYNIEGAVINSNVLQLQGLYDGSYFSFVKEHTNDYEEELIVKNEIVIKEDFYYLKPIDDAGYENKYSHIPFFYISDIHLEHRVCNQFSDKATKEEIRSYIKYLAGKMISSIGSIPFNSYLLIAGDTSSIFEFTTIFFNELIKLWSWPKRIIVISGNHELGDPWFIMDKNIEKYREFFKSIGIIFLHNDLFYLKNGERGILSETCEIIDEKEIIKMNEEAIRQQVQHSSVIILGGIGFSGLNKNFNASNLRFGKSFDELPREEALQKDIEETNRFNAIYMKLLKALNKNRVIVLTHTKKEDWNADAYNSQWIYLNGHNHRNFYEVNDRRMIYADNQIGYKSENIGLKYFYCDNVYDTFAYYQDGIHEIMKEQYIDFNRGKLVSMSFSRENGTIYMLKRNDMYMFVIYCTYTKQKKNKHLYLLNGGKLIHLKRNGIEDLTYYYDNLIKYTENIKQLLHKYTDGQRKLSKFIKQLGGSGKIHGCIVDVERPEESKGFSYCHLYVNPLDGKVTPYFAWDVRERIVYKDFKTLLQAHNSCKLMVKNYLQLEKESIKNLPTVQYVGQMEEWENKDSMYDEGSYIYKISRIIKSLQYCTEKNIVRLWNEDLLNHDFIARIEHAKQVNEIVDERLIFDGNILNDT